MANRKSYRTVEQIDVAVKEVIQQIERRYSRNVVWPIYPIPRGGWMPASLIQTEVNTRKAMSHTVTLVQDPSQALFAVDDLIDSGSTAAKIQKEYGLDTYALYDKKTNPKHKKMGWIVFPWEIKEDACDIEDNYLRILQYIGEDVGREGLLDTPKRAAKAIQEITAGMHITEEQLKEKCTTFSSEGYDGTIALDNINFTSMCEHHMLPFFGTASLIYKPGKKLIGASKPARILDAFASRLQNQERITQQVLDFFVEHVEPLYCKVELNAAHTCMMCRGVEQAQPGMITKASYNAKGNNEPAT